jgi:hypothetical protein
MQRAVFGLFVAMGVAVGLTGLAQPPPGTTTASGSASASARTASADGNIPSLAALFDGATFRWGMPYSQTMAIYSRSGGVIDQDYAPVLAKMQPGTRMEGIIGDRENKKLLVRTQMIRFDDLPCGFDSGPLRKEYSYMNAESMHWLERPNDKLYFFYFGGPVATKLWKIYHEMPLKADGPLGATYAEAVAKLTALLGAPGHVVEDDTTQQVTTEWQDGVTRLRVIDRSNTSVVALVFEERATVARLSQLRLNKPLDPTALDPDVASAMRNATKPMQAPAPSAAPSSSGR